MLRKQKNVPLWGGGREEGLNDVVRDNNFHKNEYSRTTGISKPGVK